MGAYKPPVELENLAPPTILVPPLAPVKEAEDSFKDLNSGELDIGASSGGPHTKMLRVPDEQPNVLGNKGIGFA